MELINEVKKYTNEVWNRKAGIIKKVSLKIKGNEENAYKEIENCFKQEIEENPNNRTILYTMIQYAIFYERDYITITNKDGFLFCE
jgi:hypothetical protein